MDALPKPFLVPSKPHVRRHSPSGYVDFASYKPWLRDEFQFQCVFCLFRERWYPDGQASFAVEHFQAKSKFGHFVDEYCNLLYSCCRCNSFKSIREDIPNPTIEAFSLHLMIDQQGKAVGITRKGKLLVKALHLDSPRKTDYRRKILAILAAKRMAPDNPEVDRIFRDHFSYPADLPDLRSKRAGANAKGACHLSARESGTLPEVY